MIGQRIRKMREKRGLTQEQLASMIDINRATLNLIENGQRKVTSDDIINLRRELSVRFDSFFQDEEISAPGWKIFTGEGMPESFTWLLVRYKKGFPISALWCPEQKHFVQETQTHVPLLVTEYMEIPE